MSSEPTKTCPRKRTGMTPCVITDGDTARRDNGACIGCGRYFVRERGIARAPQRDAPDLPHAMWRTIAHEQISYWARLEATLTKALAHSSATLIADRIALERARASASALRELLELTLGQPCRCEQCEAERTA